MRRFLIALVVLFCVSPSRAAAEKSALPRGARIAVVAVRDATQLALCPVVGKQVSVSPISTNGRTTVVAKPERNTPVAIYRPRDGVLVIELREQHVLTSRMMFADVASGPLNVPAPSPDANARNAIEALPKAAGYIVTSDFAAAFFVLYVQSTYRPSPVSIAVVSGLREPPPRPGQRHDPGSRPDDIRSQTDQELARRNDRTGGADTVPLPARPKGSDVDRRWDGGSYDAHEWQGDWRESALAVLVPPSAFRADDVSVTTAERVWEGFTAGRMRTAHGTPALEPASIDTLVQQLTGKAKRSPGYLPLCAVAVTK